MAAKISLRDYQRDLSARLTSAASGRVASKLAVQAGEAGWLLDLGEAGEVIPVPPITPVPLTQPWFKGIVNVRGNLYNVVDFGAFLGAAAVTINESSRLLLLAEGLLMKSALLIDRSLGLRDPADLQLEAEGTIGSPWVRGQYTDKEGKRWKELDVRQLVQHASFLSVAA